MITVSNVRPGKGKFVAHFDFTIDAYHFTLYGCGLYSGEKGKFILYPSRKSDTPQGPKYYQYFKWSDRDVSDKFRDAIVPLVEEQLKLIASTPPKEEEQESTAPTDPDTLPF